MSEFQKYRRTNIAEMRPYDEDSLLSPSVSISASDLANGSPKRGDMIARNPENHDDQWLVAADYFAANFEPYDGVDSQAEIEQLRGLLFDVLATKAVPMWLRVEIKDALATEQS